MVHHEQVGTPLDGFSGDLERRVDREHDARDLPRRVTGDEADRVPGVGCGGRVPGVEQVDDVRERGHAVIIPDR